MTQKKHDVNIPAAGSFGAPPAGAPIQTSSADVSPTVDQIRTARANEQAESVYAPKPMSRAAMVALIGEEAVQRAERAEGVVAGGDGVAPVAKPAGTATTPQLPAPSASASADAAAVIVSGIKPPDIAMPSKRRRMGSGPAVGVVAPVVPKAQPTIVLTDAEKITDVTDLVNEAVDILAAVEAEALAPAPPAQVVGPRRPAESDTDTPARGLPRPIEDPGKKITGGFGDVGDAQYFPLDGFELKTLVEGLMSQIHARLQDDLRFSVACVYPRVTARVVVEIQGFTVDQSFQIPKIAAHDKTPSAIARARSDEIVFCLVSERQEMTEDGQSVTPPNQTRIDLGLPVPRKQAIETPGGRQLVDVTTSTRD